MVDRAFADPACEQIHLFVVPDKPNDPLPPEMTEAKVSFSRDQRLQAIRWTKLALRARWAVFRSATKAAPPEPEPEPPGFDDGPPAHIRAAHGAGRGLGEIWPSRWEILNGMAMAHFERWVLKLFPLAVSTPSGGFRVSSKALGRNLQEDLSISLQGIVDFGVADMGDPREGRRSPIDLVMEWLDLDFMPATQWLAKALTLKPLRDAAEPASEPKASAPEPSQLDALLASAADLQHMIFAPLRWVVPDILPEGCTVLAGKPKIGKSWLALDVAIAVAGAGRCLDKDCEQGDVLALLLEDNKRRLQRRLTTMLGANRERWPARLRYATEWARGDDGIALMRDWVAAVEKPRLIIVDVLQRIRAPANNRSRETQYAVEYEMMAALQKISAETAGLAVLIVHHQRKLSADDPLDTLSGTLGLSGAMDSGLILGADDNGRFLYGRGRDLEEFNISVQQGEDCRWRAGEPRGEPQPSTERASIIRALMVAGVPLTTDQIALAVGGPKKNVNNLLAKMHDDGAVIRTGRGSYALPT
jgi:hypothetical protein